MATQLGDLPSNDDKGPTLEQEKMDFKPPTLAPTLEQEKVFLTTFNSPHNYPKVLSLELNPVKEAKRASYNLKPSGVHKLGQSVLK